MSSWYCSVCKDTYPEGTTHICSGRLASSIAGLDCQKTEAVNHPNHYGGDTVYETIKVLKAWLTHEEYVGFLKGNVIKYLSRATRKHDHNENVAKATWYQNELDKYLKEYV
jgi:hypothetical protein